MSGGLWLMRPRLEEVDVLIIDLEQGVWWED